MDIFGWTAVIAILAFIAMGLYFSRQATNVDEYYVMGRRAPWWMMGFAVMATWLSLWTFLGMIGTVAFAWGAPQMTFVYGIASPIGVLMFIFLFAIPFRRLNLLTVPDFFAERFGSKRVRAVSVLVTIIAMLFYIMLQLSGGAILLEIATGIPYELGVWIFFASIVIYVMAGGMWSTTVYDSIMFVFMAIFGMGMLFVLYGQVGGWEGIFATTYDKYPQVWQWLGFVDNPWSYYIFFAMSWWAVTSVSPHLINRALCVREEKDIIKGATVGLSLAMTCVIALCVASPALLNYFDVGAFKPDWLQPNAIKQGVYPLWFGVPLLAVLIAAGGTTCNSQLLVAGQGLARDIYQKLINPNASERMVINLTRLFVLVIGLIGVAIALPKPWLLVVAGTLTGVVLSAGYFPVVLFSLYWGERMSEAAAFWSMVISIPLTLFIIWGWTAFGWFKPFPAAYAIPLGFLITLILMFTTKRTEEEKKIWERLKPIVFARKEMNIEAKDYWQVYVPIAVCLLIIIWITFGALSVSV